MGVPIVENRMANTHTGIMFGLRLRPCDQKGSYLSNIWLLYSPTHMILTYNPKPQSPM